MELTLNAQYIAELIQMMLLGLVSSDSLSRAVFGSSVDVGTQILAALIVGLIAAFAFQLLLTSLGLAIGITALGFGTVASTNGNTSKQENLQAEDSETEDFQKSSGFQLGSTFSKISVATGFSLLATIDTVLFAATFLSVTVTQIGNPISGALVGLVIWSAYFLILLWISSIAISSIAGSILDLATAGVRRLVGAIGSTLTQSKDTQSDVQSEGLLTEGAAIELIRQETALSLANIRPMVEEYFKTIAPPNLERLQRDLVALVKDLKLPIGELHSSDRLRLMELIQQRTGLSQSEVDQLVKQLEYDWQESEESTQPLPFSQELVSELLRILRFTSSEKIEVNQLGAWLEHSVDENPSRVSQFSRWLSLPKVDFKHLLRQAFSQIDFAELVDASGLELSDIQIEDVWQQFQVLQQRFQEQSNLAADSEPVVAEPTVAAVPEEEGHLRQKLDFYLRYTNPEKLTPDGAELKLRQLLAEAEVSLPPFKAVDWMALLDRRKSLTQSQRQQIIARLAEVWQSTSPDWEAKHLQISKPQTLQLPDFSPDSSIQPKLESLFSKVSDYFDSFSPPSFDEQKLQQILDRLLENPKFHMLDLEQWVKSVLSKTSSLSAVKLAFETPQSAIQALSDRVDQWSQELFTQLLAELSEGLPQSRQLLAEALPQPFLIQAEKLRDRLLQQTEGLQQQAQEQLEGLQKQARQRIEETRQVAAIAAWWLFFTAFSAACSAAIAGTLGVEFLKIK